MAGVVEMRRPVRGYLTWSACIQNARTGQVLFEHAADTPLSTASVGKVLLLIEVARQIGTGKLRPDQPLTRTGDDHVEDSGLWQHLAVDTLSLADACSIVGAVSDNLATNVLLRKVGLAAVEHTAAACGLSRTRLHDRVRDVRTEDHPARLSTGSAGELTRLFTELHRGHVVDMAVSRQVLSWLTNDADLSMAASVFALDPLSHSKADRGIDLVHKTGTDDGVRVDCGLVRSPGADTSYAFLINWDVADDLRDPALDMMRGLGALLRNEVGV